MLFKLIAIISLSHSYCTQQYLNTMETTLKQSGQVQATIARKYNFSFRFENISISK